MTSHWRCFGDRGAAEQSLVQATVAALQELLARSKKVHLVVPGGQTPQGYLRRLASANIAWPRVCMSLTDERCLPLNDPDRNETMLRACMASALEQGASIVSPLDATGRVRETTVADADVLILGVGQDGHVASLFSGAAAMASAMPDASTSWVSCDDAPDGFRRVSRPAAALTAAPGTWLLCFGQRKRDMLDAALAQPATADALPVAHVPGPLIVWWAP